MERKEVFEFDGFHVVSESFLDKDSYCVVTGSKKDGDGEPYLHEQGKQKKLTLAKVKDMYGDSEVVMGEMLASTAADGLSVEEAFYLYIAAQNWANGDEFSQVLGDNDECEVDLVKEALRLNQ